MANSDFGATPRNLCASSRSFNVLKKATLFFSMVVISLSLRAQFDYNFWLPPLWDGQDAGLNQPSSLFITTPYSTPVNVHIQTADGTTFVFDGTVISGTPLVVPLSTTLGQTNLPNTADVSRGLIITSSAPIQCVHKVSAFWNQTLVTLKGRNGLGTDFWCASQVRNQAGMYYTAEYHYISVMATENNTQVNFQTPFAMWSSGGTLPTNFSITLQKNQSYLVRSVNNLQHVTGAHVTSNKKIVVISGSTHTRIAGGGCADGGTDQLVPVELSGNKFAVIKGDNANPFDYAIVVATQNNTNIFIDGSSTPIATLNQGQYYDWTLTGTFGTPHAITTNRNAYVYHVSGVSQTCEVDMSAMPQLECTGSRYIEFSKFTETGLDQVMPVLAPATAYPTLRLNNVLASAVPGAIINNVPGLTGWKSITFPNATLAQNNVLKSDGFFHAGWLTGSNDQTGAYGYLSGFNDAFEFQDPVSGLPTFIYQLGPICQGQSLDHCVKVKSCGSNNSIQSFSGNLGNIVIAPPTQPFDTCFRYTAPFNFTGYDTVSFIFNNEFGFTGELNIVFKVVNPNTPINAGPDQQLCSVSTTTLQAINPDPLVNGFWTVAQGTGVLANANSPVTAVTNLSLGPNTFVWNQNYPCANRADIIQVFRYSGTPPAADAGPDALICSSGNATYTMQANNPGVTATGTWEILSGNATIFNINANNAVVSNIGIGVNTFRWNISNGPCPGSDTQDIMTINVFNVNHPAANAGADQSICGANTTVNLTANAAQSPAIGQWSVIQGSATFANSNSAATTATGFTVGTNILRWTINNGPCGILTDDLVITVYSPTSPAANAGSNQNICLPTNTASLSANTPTFPAIGTWSVIQGSGSFQNVNLPNSSVSGLSVGTNRFRWTVNNGACANPITTSDVIITVYPVSQPAANAGTDQSLCRTGSDPSLPVATLIANASVSPGTGAWSVISGTGTFANASNPTTTVSGLSLGQNVFQWTLTNGPCSGGSSDQVIITVFNSGIAQAQAGPDQNLCTPQTSASLSATAPISPATGVWTVVSGSGTFSNTTAANAQVTNLGIGQNVLRWAINNGPCAGNNFDEVIITVFSSGAPVANAGPDQNLCFNGSAVNTTLAGSTLISPATGSWSLISGSGSITDPTNPSSSVTGLQVGTSVFQWTVNNGPCGNTSDQVVINVFSSSQLPANAGIDQSICSSQTSTSLSANSIISPATGQWSVVSGTGTFANASSPNTAVSGYSVGQNVYRWTINNGPCSSPSLLIDDVVITVYNASQSPANAGPDQNICSTTTNISLSANAPVFPATGSWSLLSGSGVFGNSSSPVSTVTSYLPGTSVYQWTINNGPCGAPTSDIIALTVADVFTPTSNAGADQSICSPISSVLLNGNPVSPPATAQWTIVSGTGSLANSNSPTSTLSALTPGLTVARWTISNPLCGQNTSDDVVITTFNNNAPSPNAGPDGSLCTPSSTYAMQGNNIPSPGTGIWSLVSGTGTISDVNNPNAIISGLGIGANIFRWSLSNGPCSNTGAFDEMTIFVFDQNNPSADAGADQSLCFDGTNPVVANLSGSSVVYPATGQWSIVQGAGTFSNAQNPNTSITGLAVGENIFRWTVSNGPCANSTTFDDLSIFVYPLSQPAANAGADQDVCSSTATVQLNANTPIFPGTGSWSVIQGSAVFANAISPTTSVSGLSLGTNILQWTIFNGPCNPSSTSDLVTITIYDASQLPANAGSDIQICSSQPSIALNGNAFSFPTTANWTLISGTGNIQSANTSSPTITGLSVGTNSFRYTLSNGPCVAQSVDDINITVYDNTQPAANAGVDASICLPQNTFPLSGNSPVSPAVGTWTIIQGSGSINNPSSASTVVQGLSAGQTIIRWTVNNGPCSPSSTFDDIQLTIFDNTQASANAGPDQSWCEPISTASLAANAANFPATGQWILVSGSGTIVSPSSATTVVTGLAQGENVFRWTINNGACSPPQSSDDVSIFIYESSQPAADAGADISICSPTNSVTMSANSAIFPAFGTWVRISGAGDIADINDPSSAISNLQVGENVFEWRIFNGPCANQLTTDRVSIFVYDSTQPNADAGTDLFVCTPTTSVSLSANSPIFPATGHWELVSGSGTFSDANSPTTNVNNLVVGVNVFRWVIDNGGCGSGTTSDLVSVSVFNQFSPNASAGNDQNLCTPQTSTTLQGNTPIFPATGFWTLVSGAGTITDPTNPNSGVTDLAIGPNVFQWTISNGPCANAVTSDQITITVFDSGAEAPFAGNDLELCSPQSTSTLNANPAVFPGVGTWTVITGSGIFSNVNDPNTTVSGLGIGVNTFRWSVNYATCGSPFDDVNITVYDSSQGASDAGADEDLCSPVTSYNLNAQAVIPPGYGTWSVVAGAGAVENVNDPQSGVLNLGLGDNVFVWTVYNGPCLLPPLTTDTVIIRVFNADQAAANAGNDQSLCTPQNYTQLSGSAVVYPTTGSWSLIQGGGTIANPAQPITDITDLPVGENIFRWTVNNGPCANAITSDDVSVFIYDEAQPDADAGQDQFICTPLTTVQLNANSVIFPATGQWSLLSGTGNITDPTNPQSTVTGLGVGENIFQWTINNGPCANGITTDIVSIFVYDSSNPAANAGADQEWCLPSNTGILAASNYIYPATGNWSIISGALSLQNNNDPTSSFFNAQVGENILVWTVDNGVCSNGITRDTVSIFIFDPFAPVADAGSDLQFCTPVSSAALNALVPSAPGYGTWAVVSSPAPVSISNINDPAATVTGLLPGETILEWTVYNGPCATTNTTDRVSIVIFDALQSDANAGSDSNICLPQNSLQLSANSYLFPATGSWSLVSGQGTFADPTDPATLISNLGVGANVIRWTIDNGPCPSGVTASDITINVFDSGQLPANAGLDQELCLPTTSITLQGSALIGVSSGLWTLVSGSGTFDDASLPGATVSDLSQGVNTLVWSVDNGACGLSADTVRITIYDNDAPVASAGNDASFCTPTSTYQMTANTPEIPGVGTWSIDSTSAYTGAGTIDDLTNPLANISGLVIGENRFIWTIYNGPCELVTTDSISIFIYDENQPAAYAGEDAEICLPQTTYTFQANGPIFPAVAQWSQISGPSAVSFSNISDSVATISGLTTGSYSFVWNINNGPCANAITSDTIVIDVFDPSAPEASAGPDQEWCTPVSSTVMLAQTPSTPGYGTWSLIQGNAVIADIHDPNTAITNLEIGETCLLWTVYNGECDEISSDDVCIRVFDFNQTAADAGADQLLCTPNTDAQMSANQATFPASGSWSVVTGGIYNGQGTINDVNDPNTVISGLVPGTSAFVWTIDNGPCSNGITRDTVVISVFFNDLPLADAGLDTQLCLPENTITLNGSAISGAATGQWTLVQGSATIESPQTSSTFISDLGLGVNVFAWIVDNGACGTSSDSVIVTVYENLPLPTAGEDAYYCTPTSTHTMAASPAPVPAVGTWTRLTGSGVITDPHDPNTTITGLTTGENIFLWCVETGPCAAPQCDVMSIFIYNENTPNANAGPDIEICLPQNSVPMQASSAEFPAVGTWQVITEPSFGSTIIGDVNSPSSVMSNLAVGTTVFVWTVDNGPCPNGITSDTVTVRVYDPGIPGPNAGSDQNLCTPNVSTLLQGTAPQDPVVGTWSVIQGSGTIGNANSPNSPLTNLAVGINLFAWSYYNGNCTGSLLIDTVAINVFDGSQPPANAGPDQQLCLPQSTAIMAGNLAIVPATGHWEIATGFGVIENPDSPTTSISSISVGTNAFVWVIDNGPCVNAITSDTVIVQVFDPGATGVSAGEDIQICTPQSCVELAATALPDPQVGTWTYISAINGSGPIPQGGISDIHDPLAEVCGLVVGLHTLEWGVNNGPCNNGNLDQVTIAVYDATAPPADAGSDIFLCSANAQTNLTGNNAIFPGVGTWEIISGNATIADVHNPSTQVSDLPIGICVLTWSIDNGPCSPVTVDTLRIQVNDPNSPNADAGPDAGYCTDFATHIMTGNAPIFPAIGTWSVISGSGTFQNPNDPSTAVINIPLNENIFVWTIDNGACANGITTDTISIYVNDAAVAAANAGPDITLCGAPDSIRMNASVAVGLAEGYWLSLDGVGNFADTTNHESYLSGLTNGVFHFLWTVDNGACGISSDTLKVSIYNPDYTAAYAGEDQLICEHEFSSFNLIANEVSSPTSAWWSIEEGPVEISSTISSDALVETLGNAPDFGLTTSVLIWHVDNGVCGSSQDTVTFTLKDCLSILVPNAFSPNGDGVNDFFVVPNIAAYPKNSLKIFNRWGTQIFEASPYKNDWDGRSHHPSSLGEILPVSTYYYILDLGTGEEAFHGFVYLKR